MKKNWILAAVLVAGMVGTASAELRIATVNLDTVFTAHPKTQLAEEGLKKAETRIKADMEKMSAEANALQEEAQKLSDDAQKPMLSEAARMQKKLDAEDKVTALQELQLRIRRTQETRLKQLRDQLMKTRQGIVDELLTLVSDFAKEEGYDLILDRSGLTMNAVALVVFSDDELDVTDAILKKVGALPAATADAVAAE